MSVQSLRMPRIVALCALLVGSFLLGPARASVIYTSRTSTVSIMECGNLPAGCFPGQPGFSTVTQSATDLNPFSASLSSAFFPDYIYATQQSQISGNTITVSLTAGGEYESTATSSFDLTFVLDTPTDFALSGRRDDGAPIDPSRTDIRLSGPTLLGVADVNCQSTPGDHCTYNNQNPYPYPYSAKTLSPGTYTLDAFASGGNGSGAGSGFASLTLSLTPVPLPAAMLLLGSALGMLGLLGGCKQHRTDHPA
jgi:hypothetical protein